jgi:hypothetical protein
MRSLVILGLSLAACGGSSRPAATTPSEGADESAADDDEGGDNLVPPERMDEITDRCSIASATPPRAAWPTPSTAAPPIGNARGHVSLGFTIGTDGRAGQITVIETSLDNEGVEAVRDRSKVERDRLRPAAARPSSGRSRSRSSRCDARALHACPAIGLGLARAAAAPQRPRRSPVEPGPPVDAPVDPDDAGDDDPPEDDDGVELVSDRRPDRSRGRGGPDLRAPRPRRSTPATPISWPADAGWAAPSS